jgi:hypothetical protein
LFFIAPKKLLAISRCPRFEVATPFASASKGSFYWDFSASPQFPAILFPLGVNAVLKWSGPVLAIPSSAFSIDSGILCNRFIDVFSSFAANSYANLGCFGYDS